MCVLFGRGRAQGFLNDQVSPSLSLLPAKQKKHELPSYLRLSHALHSLKQTQLHIHLCVHTHTKERCTHTHTQARTHVHLLWQTLHLMETLFQANTHMQNTFSNTFSVLMQLNLLFFFFFSQPQYIHVLVVSFRIHRALFLLTDFLAGTTLFCRGRDAAKYQITYRPLRTSVDCAQNSILKTNLN